MQNLKQNWKLPIIITASAIAFILLCVFGIQSSQNKEIGLEESIITADSDIKVQEKRRVDLVYNLADCIQQYDKHESSTLETLAENMSNGNSIEEVNTAIAAVGYAYPELKSSENYKQLMNELSITENLIAQYRENYNKSVEEYNRYCKGFPERILLGLTGYEKQDYKRLSYDVGSDAPQNLFGK